MKPHFKFLLPVMALFMAALCCITLQLITQIQSYGKLINYVGIVRGATQRLVKLELSDSPNDEIMSYLDRILEELTTGQGEIGLKQISDLVYNQHLTRLNSMWHDLKKDIQAVRSGSAKEGLLSRSEEYFDLANDTVFAVETYSNYKTRQLSILILAITIAMVLTWSVILITYLKRLLRLQITNRDLSGRIYTDPVTGAPNLEKFHLEAQRLIALQKDGQFAVFHIDIDNFKYYNDAFGRQYGDELLKKYTEFLRNDMGSLDTFCRMSSDNFLVLRHYDDKSKLIDRQEKVDGQLAEYVLKTKDQHLFTLSYGICCIEDLTKAHQITSLIERANFARKTVKNQSLTHYAFYNESIRDQMLAVKSIENSMQAAMDNHEFVFYLQPKIRLSTGRIDCAEALVRWITPDKQIIPPDDFIPVFEKNLFITALDQYVFEEVCIWLRSQIDAGNHVVPISVNVSRMQFYDPEFVNTYMRIKNQYQIPSGMLEVEFTESIVFENLTILLKIIAALKTEGFLCSLDDFGKGYSSLNLLRNLPVDVLKLDKLFFDDNGQMEKSHTIIAGLVSMAKNLNIEIVAEGVEQEQQLQFLYDIECDLVQGYVFYRPMPVKEFELLLAENKPL